MYYKTRTVYVKDVSKKGGRAPPLRPWLNWIEQRTTDAIQSFLITLEITVKIEEMQARQALAPFCLLLGILPVAVYFDLLTAQIPHIRGGVIFSLPPFIPYVLEQNSIKEKGVFVGLLFA
jgi:hypothetical protein